MEKTAYRWFGRSLVVMAVVVASACANDTSVATTMGPGKTAVADITDGKRFPDLTACPQLTAPDGSTLLLHAFGIGFQIYHWNGTSWGVATPSATIYADAGGNGAVASHFAGPTWQSNSGGSVVGTVANRCVPDPASIAWLSLNGVPNGPGIFSKVNFIQRLNTVGGNPPSTPGSTIGQEAKIPYTADYLFYKAP